MTDIRAEYAALQTAYDDEEAALLAKGYSVSPKPGTDAWRAFVGLFGGAINSSFENVTPENSMALFAQDSEGDAVGAIALRVYDIVDLRELLITGRLWLPAHEARSQRIEYCLSDDFPTISGRVVQIGGLKVIRTGERIGSHLDRMARLTAASIFHADHIVAVRRASKVTTMPKEYYGAARTALAFRALPIVGDVLDVHLTHISREELLSGLAVRRHDDALDPSEIIGEAI
jgi:hypothetical protein